MQAKHKKLLTELLETYGSKLNEWEKKVFGEWQERDNQKEIVLTQNMIVCLEKARKRYIQGMSKNQIQKEGVDDIIPSEYPNCRMRYGNDNGVGYFIWIGNVNNEVMIKTATTKKEGLIILAWLQEAMKSEEFKQALGLSSTNNSEDPLPLDALEDEENLSNESDLVELGEVEASPF